MTNRRGRSSKLPVILIMVIAFAGFYYSGKYIANLVMESRESNTITERLTELAVTNRQEAATDDISAKADISLPEPQELIGNASTEMPVMKDKAPIEVDFDLLRRENNDIVGWIYCEDTVINYPIVQAKDNDYYLVHLTDGQLNPHGTIFLDYRCDNAFTDANSVIYGHHMKDKSMFATIENYREQEYYDEHPVMYLLTPEADYRVILQAGCTIDNYDELYELPADKDSIKYIREKLMRKSTFIPKDASIVSERYLSLSTCSYEFDNARYVLIGSMYQLER